MATTTAIFADPEVLLRSVSWETYEKLLEDLSDCSVPHLTYDRGVLSIMSPTNEHEEYNRALNLIVEIVAAELEVRARVLGSSTFKRKDLRQGFEPDSCFYVASAKRIRGKKKLDLAVDPPPDLVIEIDITTSSIPKMPIFAHFGVPEVWQFDGRSLRMWKLQGDEYTSINRSLSFSILSPRVLEDFLAKSEKWEDRPRLVRFIREWVAGKR
ncbi:MAG: Uma2 family endonuclease [Vicinamibacteria bacterium]